MFGLDCLLSTPAKGYFFGEDAFGVYLEGQGRVQGYFHLRAPRPGALPPPARGPRLRELDVREVQERLEHLPKRRPRLYLFEPLAAAEESGPALGLHLGPGCTYACKVCSTGNFTFYGRYGEEAPSPGELARLIAERMRALKATGFFTDGPWLTLLGSEPTLFTAYLLEALAELKKLGCTPYVNLTTNGHYDDETRIALTGIPDQYTFSLRAAESCAESLGLPRDHRSTVLRTIRATLAEDSEARALVRLWIVAGHAECCARPLLGDLAKQAQNAHVALVPIMPLAPLGDSPVTRLPAPDEVARVAEWASSVGLGLVPAWPPVPEEMSHVLEIQDPCQRLKRLQALAKDHPANPLVHLALGREALLVGQERVALDAFMRASELEPLWSAPLLEAMKVAQKRGDTKTLLALKAQVARIEGKTFWELAYPNHPPVHTGNP